MISSRVSLACAVCAWRDQDAKNEGVALPALDKTFKPAFLWRNTSCWSGRDADFSAHVRDNSGSGGPDNAQGIQYAFDGTCHSYFTYVSPGEFFEQHPEYFSEIGGQRRSMETQLCLSNPDVLGDCDGADAETDGRKTRVPAAQLLTDGLLQRRDARGARRSMRNTARPAAPEYRFLNQLAERTSKKFPNKLIGILPGHGNMEELLKGMQMHLNVARAGRVTCSRVATATPSPHVP